MKKVGSVKPIFAQQASARETNQSTTSTPATPLTDKRIRCTVTGNHATAVRVVPVANQNKP